VAVTGLLLDTSAYSAYRLGHEGLREELREAGAIYMSPIVLGELRAGFRRGAKRAANDAGLREFLASSRVHVLPVTESTAERYAEIRSYLASVGGPIPTNDIWIAASAMEHGLVVLTVDTHFQRIPQIVVRHYPRWP
jgi:predicted nucleic acid-binding protein